MAKRYDLALRPGDGELSPGRKAQVPAGGDWAPRFIEVLAEVGHVGRALAMVGVSYSTMQRHRQQNPEFAEAFRMARAEACAKLLEPVAFDRAILSDKSDGLLRWLMERMDPELWGQTPSKVEVSGPGGGPVTVAPAPPVRINKPGGE